MVGLGEMHVVNREISQSVTCDDLLARSSNEVTTTTPALIPSGPVPTLLPSPNISNFLSLGWINQADSLNLEQKKKII